MLCDCKSISMRRCMSACTYMSVGRCMSMSVSMCVSVGMCMSVDMCMGVFLCTRYECVRVLSMCEFVVCRNVCGYVSYPRLFALPLIQTRPNPSPFPTSFRPLPSFLLSLNPHNAFI